MHSLTELRQSAAVILAYATHELFPGLLLAGGYVTEFGFAYDFIAEQPIDMNAVCNGKYFQTSYNTNQDKCICANGNEWNNVSYCQSIKSEVNTISLNDETNVLSCKKQALEYKNSNLSTSPYHYESHWSQKNNKCFAEFIFLNTNSVASLEIFSIRDV